MLNLESLTLDQVPALTDEDFNRLHAELSEWTPPTREEAIKQVAEDIIDARIEGGAEEMHWVSSVVDEIERQSGRYDAEITEKMKPPAVCHEDCPASVLQALPGLVERRTGICMRMTSHYESTGRIEAHLSPSPPGPASVALLSLDARWSAGGVYRHIPHACMAAAFAACIVLGKKQEG